MRTSKHPLAASLTIACCRGALLGTALLSGCASLFGPDPEATENATSRMNLSATRIEACKPLGTTWELAGQVQDVDVFRNAGKWVLVYETRLRNGPRTVWQPLTNDLAIDGDGIAVGDKALPFIADFQAQNDAQGNAWIQYRAKRPGSELFSAYVELVDVKAGDKLSRIRLPTSTSESVQEAWLLPNGPSTASVVLRVNPYGDSGNETTLFRWYTVDMKKNSTRAAGEFRQAADVLSSTRFLALAKTGEPVAFAVVSRNQDFAASDPKFQRASFRIVAKRIFAKVREEAVLLDSHVPLANLTLEARPGALGKTTVLLAWLQEPSGNASTLVQWLSLSFEPNDAGFALLRKSLSTRGAAPKPLVRSVAVEHDPVRLNLRSLPATGSIGLSWWTASEEDSGYLVTQVFPPRPDVTVADGYDAKGQPRKKTRSPLLGSYSPDRKARIVGVAVGAGPRGSDVIMASEPSGEKNIEGGSRLTLCAVGAR